MKKIKVGQYYRNRYLRVEYNSIIVIKNITYNKKFCINYAYLYNESIIMELRNKNAFQEIFTFISPEDANRYINEKIIKDIIE
jgi:hypothetical protein